VGVSCFPLLQRGKADVLACFIQHRDRGEHREQFLKALGAKASLIKLTWTAAFFQVEARFSGRGDRFFIGVMVGPLGSLVPEI